MGDILLAACFARSCNTAASLLSRQRPRPQSACWSNLIELDDGWPTCYNTFHQPQHARRRCRSRVRLCISRLLYTRLRSEGAAAGGRSWTLLGSHEIISAERAMSVRLVGGSGGVARGMSAGVVGARPARSLFVQGSTGCGVHLRTKAETE